MNTHTQCPYHQAGGNWDECSEGFKNCSASKPKSTPTSGPWYVDNDQPNDLVRIIGAVDGDTYDDGSPRQIFTHICDVIDNEDEQANAKLIAKAPLLPKLAEALRDTRRQLEDLRAIIIELGGEVSYTVDEALELSLAVIEQYGHD